MIRIATLSDLDPLVAIENRSFSVDRFSRRTFRYLLSRANAATLVEADEDDAPRGYVMVLFTRGTSLARLYSIAVDPHYRRGGTGAELLAAAEATALHRDTAYMRLEVRADDPTTQAFYRNRGYRPFATHAHYYEDDADAIRMEKALAPHPDPTIMRVPFYAQTLDFTCGPAALMMAMHALDPDMDLDQGAEVRIWRESTTVFMTAGHGGCSPEGLALAAHRRGFDVELFLSGNGVLFIDSVRSESKKAVVRLVQEDFRSLLEATPVQIVRRPISLAAMREKFDACGVLVILISSYRFDRQKAPHWVVVTGFDEKYVYLHDPNVDEDLEKTVTDCMQIPVPLKDFDRMTRYGRSQQRAALIIKAKND